MDFVSPSEVDFLVQGLRRQRIQDLGSVRWVDQHTAVVRLNQQCVLEAQTAGREELTRDLIVQNGKTKVLVQDLFSVSVWKSVILPRFEKKDLLLVHTIKYHELILVNLLELILYSGDGCESLDDVAVDLVDYAVHQVTQMIGLVHSGFFEEEESKEAEKQKDDENFTFKLGIHCVSLISYLIDKLDRLPLSVAARLLRFHDTPCLLSELLHLRPWTKKSSQGIQKFIDGEWKFEDPSKVTKTEAQTWFALHQLLFNQEAMQRYDWNDFRRQQISKCLGLLHDVLLDQMTPLVSLKQFLATLSVQQPRNGKNSSSTFLLEEVPELRNEFFREIQQFGEEKMVQWLMEVFAENEQETAQRLNDAYNVERILEISSSSSEEEKINRCSQCHEKAEKRCSSCNSVFYCSRECQVKHWPKHKLSCK